MYLSDATTAPSSYYYRGEASEVKLAIFVCMYDMLRASSPYRLIALLVCANVPECANFDYSREGNLAKKILPGRVLTWCMIDQYTFTTEPLGLWQL